MFSLKTHAISGIPLGVVWFSPSTSTWFLAGACACATRRVDAGTNAVVMAAMARAVVGSGKV